MHSSVMNPQIHRLRMPILRSTGSSAVDVNAPLQVFEITISPGAGSTAARNLDSALPGGYFHPIRA